ncbi:class I SAM-dependent DNA methyltransferase [Pseudomonas fulva]|uniref:site-specific DNA-methyltransferase (adenine-specific) n=1 Tax=Pseudomonas fulva TaxID=47880 RepID=A0A7S9Q9A5_9PSED|nr:MULTISPECIES: DNA methyltransferase [Pseudomonas]MDG9875309.1 N-6 DNA methylase [Pseudomonas juntendi]QPH44686.1 class I SAM-dependent DNA methyltransferase [Pseudomonas fulva]QPH49761.1 class I SAM-dependent DNA methyltransferase [Pseudomonas fulva]
MNAVEIESAISDMALAPFDAAEFPYLFLAAFGNKETTLKRLRAGNNNASDVPGGVLLRSNIHLAACEPGTVGEMLKALRSSLATAKAKAKFILATDGQTLEAEELTTGETITCDYPDFPNHFGFLLPLAGISTIKEIKDNPIDVRATSRLNKLYVELLNENPDWATAERRHDMNHFMARLIFCFFAEDTDIFRGNGLFTRTVERWSERDGSNTNQVLSEIFTAMNIKQAERSNAEQRLPSWANTFPYVNGGLFSGSTEVPRFTQMARTYLLHAGNLNWQKINPDIFGSMIQAVADDEERGSLGMHYTSVPNILKVLNPLFLDDLRTQLDAAGDNKSKLLNLRKRMARIRVFDPACGSGNFLVIAYKQMREIEAEINNRRGEANNKSEIPLTNFRGIELRDFPAEIARLALIIAEFQCDVLYRGQQDALAAFLPLDAQNWIVCGNSLRLDWLSICPPTGKGVKVVADDLFEVPLNQAEIKFENEGGETYICGNPPYLGAKKKSKSQSEDMSAVGLENAQLLDYVAAFIVKGLDVVAKTNTAMALVTTSSICQGEQVSLLWPKIFASASIGFAYRPFKWANSAANNAGVYCTIIGLVKSDVKSKKLYDGDSVTQCESIAPYLIPGPKVICEPANSSISCLSLMKMGSNAVDGKRLILEREAADSILEEYPSAKPYIRMYGGTKELVSGVFRRCVWIGDDSVEEVVSNIPPLKEAVDACYTYRTQAGRDARKAAKRPHAFCYSTYEDRNFIQVGNTIGGSLAFVPADIRQQGFVSNHNAFVVYGAPLVEFAIIVSSMHRVWAETVAGRLGDGIRYGNTIVYNTFPVPLLTEQSKSDLISCAESILLAREEHFPATIAELYDPGMMPENLRRAHDRNDEVLERIYIGRRFKNDTERLEKLFDLYTKMAAGTTKAAPKKSRGKKE